MVVVMRHELEVTEQYDDGQNDSAQQVMGLSYNKPPLLSYVPICSELIISLLWQQQCCLSSLLRLHQQCLGQLTVIKIIESPVYSFCFCIGLGIRRPLLLPKTAACHDKVGEGGSNVSFLLLL